jgi:hypothetical protein
MLRRFVAVERARRHGMPWVLGLAALAGVAACADMATVSPPTQDLDPAGERDDDGESTAKDAGKLADAGPRDASRSAEDAGGEPAPGPKAGSSWCEAKAILDKYCVSCHDGAGTGPMPLLTVEDLQARAVLTPSKKVYEVIGTRIHDSKNPMPPQRKLTADELAKLDAFLAAKAPAGDAAPCADEAGTADAGADPNGWDPAACDEVHAIYAHGSALSAPYEVPPGDEIHPQIFWDAPWGNEDVQLINIRPITDNKKVLHHWILYSAQGAFLMGWAPGDDKRSEFAPDIGMNMPKGARSLRLDMHYFNTMGTQVEKDRSGLEVCIVKGAHLRPKAAAVTMEFNSIGPVLAPAGANNRPSTGTCNVTTTQPVTLMTANPHAHKYATHMRFTVKKKSGEEIVLHDGDFRFGEQQTYDLEPDVVLETGDTVYTTCSYTNNTTRNITVGESTTNEMCFNFAAYWPAGALSCGWGGLFGLGF